MSQLVSCSIRLASLPKVQQSYEDVANTVAFNALTFAIGFRLDPCCYFILSMSRGTVIKYDSEILCVQNFRIETSFQDRFKESSK